MNGWEITVWALVCTTGSLTFLALVAHRIEAVEAAHSRETRRSVGERNRWADNPDKVDITPRLQADLRVQDGTPTAHLAGREVDASPG